jgi:hypothetical protein
MEKLSPLEQNAAKQLESFDPFANLPIPGFSLKKYERDKAKEAEAKKQVEEPKKEEPVKKSQKEKKPARKAKLESVLPPEPENIKVESQDNPIIESRNSEGMPSYRCEFGGRDIFVGTISYKDTNPITTMALLAIALDFGRDKIRFDFECGDRETYNMRNRIVAKFLQTDSRWLFILDGDIIPCIGRPGWMRYCVSSARNIIDLPLQRHIIHKLVGDNKSIVGAAYFDRKEGAVLACSDQSLISKAKNHEDAIVQVDWLGAGAMLIHRRVFEDIDKNYLDIKGNYFNPINEKTSDDASFCIRAKKAGHPTFIDLSVPTFHVGYKTY